jgi:uncharacterized protein involved in exopolysaccharide biosynthesis
MSESTSNIEQPEISSGDSVENHLPVMNFIKMFLRQWKLLFLVGFLAGLAGFFYAWSQKPTYESRLTFSLDAGANNSSLSGAMSLAAQFGFGLSSGQSMFDGDNIIEIMRSRRMIENVLLSVDTFNGKPFTLIQYYMEVQGFKDALQKNEYLKNISFPVGSKKNALTYLQDSILYNVCLGFSRDNLMASRPDKKLSIYEVKVSSRNERFSKIFTDRIVAETSNFYTEIISKKDRETLEILEQRVASLKGNVSSSIDTKTSKQDANINPAFAAAQSPLLKEQFNVQAYSEAYKEMFKTLEMARYQYLKQIPLLQIIDHADYPMKRIKVSRLRTGLLFSIFSVLLSMLFIWVFNLFKPMESSNT